VSGRPAVQQMLQMKVIFTVSIDLNAHILVYERITDHGKRSLNGSRIGWISRNRLLYLHSAWLRKQRLELNGLCLWVPIYKYV